ncbi:calmodulin-binding 60 A-like isoform X1 [Olea europaea subsp. europaea]|nr:calmodulin-binding 60 A-like isoform X1 [Olea europaea subsp. europaea]
MEDSFQKVKDEIQLVVEKKLIYQNWNSMDGTTTLIPRDYKLKFLDDVSEPVYTGREIEGKEGTDIKVALVESVTEDTIDFGPESSATVEILFLDAGVEDFNNSIIIANNKPHFRKPVYVNLEKGVGTWPKNVKLGHSSAWIKGCKCRLGARVVQKFDGSRIKEASTESFTVLDKRSKLYKKHDQPSLFDEVWRLKNIGKNGARHKYLQKSNISTVQQFLFLLSVDPQRLQKIFHAGPQIWKGTVDHACKCDIDDKKLYLHYSSTSECKDGVVFDVVGQLKGILHNNHYVPIESVAQAEKEDARKLLACAFENQNGAGAPAPASASENEKKASAFDNWNDMVSFDDEASFLRSLPGISIDKNATNSTGLDGHFGQYLGNADYLNELPSWFADRGANSFSDPLPPWGFDDGYDIMASYPSETCMVESNSDQQSIVSRISIVGVVMTLRWWFRAKKRVAFPGDGRVQKRQRHG